jgi:hypothetical protein
MFKRILCLVPALLIMVMPLMTITTEAAFNPLGDSKLTAYYGFEGTVTNSVTKKAAGFVSPSLVTTTKEVAYVSNSKYGKSIYFDQQYGLGLGKNIITGNHFTVAFWFNPDAEVLYRSVFSAKGSKNFEYTPDSGVTVTGQDTRVNFCPENINGNFFGSNKFLWRIEGNTPANNWYFRYMAPTSETIPVKAWSHVAIVGNEATYSIFINGKKIYDVSNEDAEATANGPRFSGIWVKDAIDFYLGVGTFGAEAYMGAVDEFYAFNRILSDSEILSLKNFVAPRVVTSTSFSSSTNSSGKSSNTSSNYASSASIQNNYSSINSTSTDSGNIESEIGSNLSSNIIESSPDTSDTSQGENPESMSEALPFIIAGVAVIIIGGCIILLLILKNKSKWIFKK